MLFDIRVGDCREVLATMPPESIDSIVTDPPYGLGFMGKGWDHAVPGVEFWTEMLRVAKPGAYLLAFGGARTFHRMACAIEDAGWEIRDTIMWLYGSGFPKSHNLGDGRGTALKPAHEPIIMARKPLVGTVAANALAYGTGALNIDLCRVEWPDGIAPEIGTPSWGGPAKKSTAVPGQEGATVERRPPSQLGRWPANVIHDGSEEVLAAFPQASGAVAPVRGTEASSKTAHAFGEFGGRAPSDQRDGGGSAARFFYCAKASRKDRNEGCEGLEPKLAGCMNMRNDAHAQANGLTCAPKQNTHPTVKPTALMRYLVRLVTPPGGTVLDPFAGSGSTGKAALLEGFRFIGIEREVEYAAIAERRALAAAQEQMFA